MRFSCNRTGRIATGSFGYYSFSDRASINRTDTITGGTGADAINAGVGVANSIIQNAGDSIAATSANISFIGGTNNIFGNGSTVTFSNSVDVITGGSLTTATPSNGNLVRNFTTGAINFVGFNSTNFLAATINGIVTSEGVIFEPTKAYSGTTIVGTTNFAGTYYVQGTYTGGVFTSNSGSAYDGVGGGNDLLIFSAANSVSINSGFFTGNANMVIIDG